MRIYVKFRIKTNWTVNEAKHILTVNIQEFQWLLQKWHYSFLEAKSYSLFAFLW
jgi:hypothetical protein